MKLPKPRKRGSSYMIEIMIDGKRSSCTRDTAKECEQWAAQRLLEAKAKKVDETNGIKQSYPFRTLFFKYYEEVGRFKKGAEYDKGQLKVFDRKFGELADKSIHDITPKDLTIWKNKRLKEVGANTVIREIGLFSSVFSYAVQELFLINTNPWAGVKKPSKPKPRHRRINSDEIDTLLSALSYKEGQVPTLPEHYVAWAFLFALETAMRRGEILKMRREHIFEKYVHLPDTKNGEARNVPLTNKAKQLLTLIQHDSERIIPQTENAFRLMWERRKAKVGLSDIHFHDTRHEASTRLANEQNLPFQVLAKMTGHKDINTLANTYYNPDINEMADMLNRE